MEIEIKIYKMSHGWVYEVGNVYQEYNPDLPGFIPMTETEATEKANIIAQRLRGE